MKRPRLVRLLVGHRREAAVSALEVLALDDSAWRRFVAAQPMATCFHQPEWARTIADAYRYSAFVVAHREPSGDILSGLPLVEVRRPSGTRRWVCLPFSDECTSLAVPSHSAETIVRQADQLRREQGVAELQVRSDLGHGLGTAELVAVTHTAVLTAPRDGEPALPRTRASVRRHVATARRSGVQVRFADRAEDLTQTYYRLHLQTRRRQGVPVQPRRYFQLLWDRMILPGQGFVLLAAVEGRAVAGAVFLLGGATVTYMYGASDPASWALRPNHAVMSTAMAWATDHGYSSFDFGRTDLDNVGLRRFKESWGAVERPLRYTTFSRDVGYDRGRRAAQLLSPVIRHCPSFVCRGLGEVLYRYAG
jgi:CelD/BcsL family acetyltransferase involved in cellulose biosynthesis